MPIALRLAKVTLGLAAGLALAEGMFWLRDGGAFPHLNIYRSDPVYGVTLRAHAQTRVAFAGNPATDVRTNARGLRGVDWDNAKPGEETWLFGDSQVFGLGVSEDDTLSAQLGRALGEPVRNVGVPTFGPLEYTQLLEQLLKEGRPRRVVFVINLANDLFELERPNRARHAVWDGWAVRIETAPAQAARAFPGRAFLMNRSHLVFAARSLLHNRTGDDAAFASEGSWRDITDSAKRASTDAPQRADANTLDERSRLSERWGELEERLVDELSLRTHESGEYGAEAKRIANYRGDPRDIVYNPYAESGRPVAATAHQLLRAALALEQNAAGFRAIAERRKDKEFIALLDERRSIHDALVAQGGALAAAPGHPVLAAVLERASLACARVGAEFHVVALPLDVQVSATEWQKYGLSPRDLGPTEALLDLVTRSADAAGAGSVNALEALREAEPGAFLDGDLHLSPDGQYALAQLIASALRDAPPKTLRLPLGRSFAPTEAEWSALATQLPFSAERATCTVRSMREWLRVECFPFAGAAPLGLPLELALERGGHGDALLRTEYDSVMVALPLLPGEDAELTLRWPDLTRRLMLARDPQGAYAVTLAPAVKLPARAALAYERPFVSPARLGVRHFQNTTYDAACLARHDARHSTLEERAACSIDHPQRTTDCEVGTVPFGVTRRCAPRCAPDGSCDAQLVCAMFSGQAGCVEP